MPTKPLTSGFVEVALDATDSHVSISFEMQAGLVYPKPRVRQDTLSVMRGPIVFVAEDVDNSALESSRPHFELVGLSESAKFTTTEDTVCGVPILKLSTEDAYTLDFSRKETQSNGLQDDSPPLYNLVKSGVPVRSWTKINRPLTLVPWFARGNGGGKGHLRVPFLRVGTDSVR